MKKSKIIYHSTIMQEIREKMDKDPWHVKLKRWYRVRVWIYTCLTRRYWDKTYSGYIFKKK